MNAYSRRQFVTTLAVTTAGLGGGLAAVPKGRRMTLCLSPGSIGVSCSADELIQLAVKHGFESIEANGGYLASLDAAKLAGYLTQLKQAGLAWGAAGLPLEFRRDETAFTEGLTKLPKIAAALKNAGVTRVGTWITPGHQELAFADNLKQHAQRLKAAASILKDQGLRLGLEYVGPKTSRSRSKHPFVYNLATMRQLLAEMGSDNAGVVLDSWHWWTAGESVADLKSLSKEQIISVDLNDAPAGIPRDEQMDGKRELPMATGVIPVGDFLNTLQKLGYDGPVRAEPFNQALNALDNEAACAATAQAMKKAFALIQV